jgi:D-3-phosphoglycerate dehydrogenase / 2-oxoglutarate reductase
MHPLLIYKRVHEMFNIKLYNKISENGLEKFEQNQFNISEDTSEPEAILLRSFKLHSIEFPKSLIAIGRAGAGVNNIPVDLCTEKSIVVFNTPGANANAVKELVLTGMFLAARNIVKGLQFVQEIADKGNEVGKLVEGNKAQFKGYELRGKKLGVIGLGAIGMMVANDAVNLGMEVQGYDPFLSVERAWGLSRQVRPATSIDSLLENSDFITFHMPLSDETKGFLSKARIAKLKKNVVILNFARGEIIDQEALIAALDNNLAGCYVTDFPRADLINNSKVVSLPHLGASTAEAEDNCAVMIADQVRGYLLNGNIINSVNFPNCFLERTSKYRLLVVNTNVPNIIGQITSALAESNINISEMLNKSRGNIAYNIIDIEEKPTEAALDRIRAIEGIARIRLLDSEGQES